MAQTRFISPDWSAKAEPVPYAKLNNPQTRPDPTAADLGQVVASPAEYNGKVLLVEGVLLSGEHSVLGPFITPGGCAIVVANPNWPEADLILQIRNATPVVSVRPLYTEAVS